MNRSPINSEHPPDL